VLSRGWALGLRRCSGVAASTQSGPIPSACSLDARRHAGLVQRTDHPAQYPSGEKKSVQLPAMALRPENQSPQDLEILEACWLRGSATTDINDAQLQG
jgi:hypothetical protein